MKGTQKPKHSAKKQPQKIAQGASRDEKRARHAKAQGSSA